jgi:hypothetical protein
MRSPFEQIGKHRQLYGQTERKSLPLHCYLEEKWRSGKARNIFQIRIIMPLRDSLAAWMLGRHAHVALTCHLLAAHLLCVAHPRIRDQTVRTRYPKKQKEDTCGCDLVKELHSVSVIDALCHFGFCDREKVTCHQHVLLKVLPEILSTV